MKTCVSCKVIYLVYFLSINEYIHKIKKVLLIVKVESTSFSIRLGIFLNTQELSETQFITKE